MNFEHHFCLFFFFFFPFSPLVFLGAISLITSASDSLENIADSFLTDTGDDFFLAEYYAGRNAAFSPSPIRGVGKSTVLSKNSGKVDFQLLLLLSVQP